MSRARINRKRAKAKKSNLITFKDKQVTVIDYNILLSDGYIIYPQVEQEYTEEDRLRDEEKARENAYFAGYDFCWISKKEYEEIWSLLTDNYTRQIHTEGFARYSFGAGAAETDWVAGSLTELDDVDLGCPRVGTNAHGDIIFAGHMDYSRDSFPTRLPYGVVMESYDLTMKFWPPAPFSADGPKLIEWLKKTNEVVKLEAMPITMDFVKDALTEEAGWVCWAGVYRRDDALLRVLADGIEFCGDFGKTVDDTADLITDADKVEALIEWIYEGGTFPLLKERGKENE